MHTYAHAHIQSNMQTHKHTHNILPNRWSGDPIGWTIAQKIPTRGARRSTHYVVDGQHFLAVASARDGTVLAAEPGSDGRASNTQVGSDIYVWDGAKFVIRETVPTNVSASLTYFSAEGKSFMVSADKRMMRGDEDPCLEEDDFEGCRNSTPGHVPGFSENSILFERVNDDCSSGKVVCQETCTTCACASLEGGQVRSAGALAEGAAENAFDGDTWTFWSAAFNNVSLASRTATSATSASSLALEYAFTACAAPEAGANVSGYTIVTLDYACPAGWMFQGSDSAQGSGTWTTLDTQTKALNCSSQRRYTYMLDDSTQPFQTYMSYRLVFLPPAGTVLAQGTPARVAIAEVELIFGSSENEAIFTAEQNTTLGYDYRAAGPPFWSSYPGPSRLPAPMFRSTNSSVIGSYGDFDVDYLGGVKLLKPSECTVGAQSPDYPAPGDSWNVTLAPVLACGYAQDTCVNAPLSLCFGASGTGTRMCGPGSEPPFDQINVCGNDCTSGVCNMK
jgi:hypothetical protein